MDVPHVTVVICTYNRSHDLPFALESVLAQRDAPPYEVIVVDNNSTDGTKAVVEAHRDRHPHLRYVFEPRQGLPTARNAFYDLALTAPGMSDVGSEGSGSPRGKENANG